MNNQIKHYRSYQFDGELYVYTEGNLNEVRSIEYMLYHADQLLNTQIGKAQERVCFDSLIPAHYRLEGAITTKEGQSRPLDPVFLDIKVAEISANFLKDLEKNPLFQEKSKDSTFAQGWKTHSQPHQYATQPPSLKGNLAINGSEQHFLYVKFSPEGLAQLEKESSQTSPLYNQFKKDLVFKPLLRKEGIDKKRGKAGSVLKAFLSLYKVETTLTNKELLTLAQELETFPFVQYCSLDQENDAIPPLPVGYASKDLIGDLSHTQSENDATPDFTHRQSYLQPTAAKIKGMNILSVWEQGIAGKGATVRHIDDGIYEDHEDFVNANIHVETNDGQTRYHGTNSVGVIGAARNGLGVTGIAHEAHLFTYDTKDSSWQLIAEMAQAGDIISCSVAVKGSTEDKRLRPIVHNKIRWDIINICAQKGATFLFGAANSSINLATDPVFNNWGLSGGIMVGACRPTDGKRQGFSVYNLEPCLNSWGDSVVSTGSGDLWGKKQQKGVNRYYTYQYMGTSAATPLVAGALALVQSHAINQYERYLTATELFALIRLTGYNEAEGQGIGVRPNVAEAIRYLDTLHSSS